MRSAFQRLNSAQTCILAHRYVGWCERDESQKLACLAVHQRIRQQYHPPAYGPTQLLWSCLKAQLARVHALKKGIDALRSVLGEGRGLAFQCAMAKKP